MNVDITGKSGMSDDASVMMMLGELKGMLTAALSRMDADRAAVNADFEIVHKRVEKHDIRITALEMARNQSQGVAIATKIVVPLVWGLVVTFCGLVAWLIIASPNIAHLVEFLGGTHAPSQ